MFNELEKPFLECVNKVINSENLFKKSSIIFLLAFALYEDSFFSEIYPNISYDNIVSCINKIDLNDDIQYIRKNIYESSNVRRRQHRPRLHRHCGRSHGRGYAREDHAVCAALWRGGLLCRGRPDGAVLPL